MVTRYWLLTLLLPLAIAHGDFNATKCAFFCFTVPEGERVDLWALSNTSCNYVVYGFAKIDDSYQVTEASRIDLPNWSYAGNYRVVTNFKLDRPEASILLGVRQSRDIPFTETKYSRQRLVESLVNQCKWYGFDGVFLDLDAELFKSFLFERFLEELDAQISLDAVQRNISRLQVVLSLGARHIHRVSHKLNVLVPYFDYIYMVSDDVESADDPYEVAQLEPLYDTDDVPKQDTISYNAEQLTLSGVPSDKIVIGLSLFARSYQLEDVQERSHGAPARGYGKVDNGDPRGRVPHKQICRQTQSIRGLDVDEAAVTTSMLGFRHLWYSFNAYNHSSLLRKLGWISARGFGGIGLYSIEADDADGECSLSNGSMSMHRYVAANFACSSRKAGDTNSSSCVRMCMLDAAHAHRFSFDNLESHMCSHIIVQTLHIQGNGKLRFGEGMTHILNAYRTWRSRSKPKLLLSVGDDQLAETWRLVTLSNTLRRVMIADLKQRLADHNADGVEIAWTTGMMEGPSDPQNLANLLDQLRMELPREKLIVATVSYGATYARRYEVQNLISYTGSYLLLSEANFRACDFVIVPGYRFHNPTRATTGHHSALFSDTEAISDRRLSIQALAGEWVSMSVPRAKLLIGISAVGIVQQFAPAQERSNNEFGARAIHSSRMRSTGGYASITEICEMLKKNDSHTEVLPGLGVPYLVVDDEFVAYDSTTSITKKSVWISMNDFGGIAFHGLERDNPEGKCPHNMPFPLLTEVAESQVCPSCPSRDRPESDCHPLFRTICYYRLPVSSDANPMAPEAIPFAKCTDIVVEEMVLDENNELNYEDGTAVDFMAKMVKMSPELEEKGLILAVRCDMDKKQFARLLDQRTPVITKLATAVNAHGFTGIELKCAHLLQGKATRTKFTNFVNDLRIQIASSSAQCQRTVSLRVPVWEKSLRGHYEIAMLNNLHYIALEPFSNHQNSTTQASSPLLGRHSHTNNSHDWSIAGTISRWMDEGLKAKSIVLILPTHGVSHQLANRTINELDSPILQRNSDELLSQSEICALLKNRTLDFHVETLYEQVSTYAHSVRGQWITYETPDTALYKVRYALRMHLGGVGFMSLNEDDVNNNCRMGKFPLLSVVPTCNSTSPPTHQQH